MFSFLKDGSFSDFFLFYVLPVVMIIGYILYYRKYSFYQIADPYVERGVAHRMSRGICPPAYPNGWYRLCRSNELKPLYILDHDQNSDVKEMKLAGRQITYFRGENLKAYAVASYCPHMGANLGIGGKVKYQKCIECPFHGWTFDGETGKCVNSEALDGKNVSTYQYCDIGDMKKDSQGRYIRKVEEGQIAIEKYHIREMNNFVYIWLHAVQKEPTYEPVRIPLPNMALRGESINYVNCHIQEIPENGADIRHFDYVHTSVHEPLLPYVQFKWEMSTCQPLEPDFYERMAHPRPKVRAFQQKLFDVFLSDKERAKNINVITLDCSILLFNRWKFYAFTLIGFQTGPATVSLFLSGPIFEGVYQQSIQPLDKFHQKVYHTIYTNHFMPYWLSAYMLYGEYRQVVNDRNIWTNKVFSHKLRYNMKTEADSALLRWRNWYSRFFEGAEKLEKEGDLFTW